MSRHSRQRQRMRAVRELRKLYGDAAEYVHDEIVEPMQRGRELAAKGLPIEVTLVNVVATTGGFEVECCGCGRKARSPVDPGSRVGLCPACARDASRSRSS